MFCSDVDGRTETWGRTPRDQTHRPFQDFFVALFSFVLNPRKSKENPIVTPYKSRVERKIGKKMLRKQIIERFKTNWFVQLGWMTGPRKEGIPEKSREERGVAFFNNSKWLTEVIFRGDFPFARATFSSSALPVLFGLWVQDWWWSN